MLTPDDWKSLLAAYGALTGTVGATIAIVNALRDRSRLRVDLTRMVRREAATVYKKLDLFGSDQFFFVEVMNAGRRVRYIYRPELWVRSGHFLIPEDVDFIFANGVWSKPGEPWESWRLDEGQSVTFVFGEPAARHAVRLDLPDSLARTHRRYYGRLSGRVRWLYGRWKGGHLWKHMRDLTFDRRRTRHHNDD